MPRFEMKPDFRIFQQVLGHIKHPQRGADLGTGMGKVEGEH